MNNNNDNGDGICILSLDNGGPGTYSQLLILKECMTRLASDLKVAEDDIYPADYFDLMGGVGFGGFVALMLGHLRMTVDEAIEGLLDVASIIFLEGSQDKIDPETNTKHLKETIEGMLQARNIPLDTKMNQESQGQTTCKVALFAASSAHLTHPHTFRTYPCRVSSLNPTIVDAICATIAMRSHFSPVKIGPRMRQLAFVGGALGANNPTRLLLNEAALVFGKSRRVAQIISVGCGLPRILSVESSDEAGVHKLLKEVTADCEIVARELSARLFNIDAYLRLNVDRGMEAITMDNWNELGAIESYAASYLMADTVSGVLDTSLQHLQRRSATITLGQLNQSSSIKVLAKQAPSVSPHFVVRKKPWDMMVHHLVTPPSSRLRIFPITGMGGCGKTQLVSYFLREYSSMYKHVVYVDASSSSSIKADFQTWVRVLGDGHERDAWEDALQILNSIPKGEQWALILDNADDPNLDLNPFLPKNGNLTILVTSRNRNVGNLSTVYHLELGEMDSDEALATLVQAARRQLPLDEEDLQSAQKLLKELGCLAVALVQAGTYCHELSSTSQGVFRPYTFTQYLALFYAHRAELMKKAEPFPLDGYKQSVYTTLDLSYQALPQQTRDFLHLISFFYHTDIPLEALAAAAANSFKVSWIAVEYPESRAKVTTDLTNLLVTDGRWNEIQVQEVIRMLRSFSLVSVTSIGDSLFLQLHPLIQSWTRDMDSAASVHYRAMAIQVLTASGRKDSFALNLVLLPHVLDILEQIQPKSLHLNDSFALGQVLQQQGHYRKATVLYENALESMKCSTLPDDLRTLSLTESVAEIYIYEGRWSEAETLLLELLNQRKRLSGEDDPSTITAAGNLASTYYYQNRWDECEKLWLQVLEQRRRCLGKEHRDTISVSENLAATYCSQGRWSEAEESMLEVLEQRKRIMGVEHPDTIFTATSLAGIYGWQDKWEEDLGILAPMVQLSLKVLGQQHPLTQQRIKDVAVVYDKLDKQKEAEEMRKLLLPHDDNHTPPGPV